MFLRYDKLEQLEFKLEKKILGFRNMQEKLENNFVIRHSKFSFSNLISFHLQYKNDRF